MTISSQQYAYLADHSYGRDERGNAVDLKALVGKSAVIGGTEYRVLAYADKPSGYQGAIYQRVDTGEIVVAHRGTEFERQRGLDLIKTDGLMAVSRYNPQADDAIALTRDALKFAKDYGDRRGIAAPEVTTTGHSLGGTHAQVSAHYFGLKGETFNAYGAASLNVRNPTTGEFYRIPEGGNAMVNHVMGADLVSAASPQYGQVRTYTNQREIDTLQRWGYENNKGFDLRFEGAAVAAMVGGSHDMHNFLPWDGNNKRDVSLLADPAAQRLAAQYDPMIDKFRGDVHTLRQMAGVLGTSPQDIIEAFQKPLEAGEPARRERQQQQQQGGRSQRSFSALDGTAPDMRDPDHPANGKYLQAYAGMERIDRSLGRTSDGTTERVAAVLTAEGVGLKEFTRVALNRDGTRVAAVDESTGPAEARPRVDVGIADAAQRTVVASTKDWQTASVELTAEQARLQAQERDNPAVRNALA